MCRSQKDPLRPLSAYERKRLEQLSRSLTMPADQVIHAKEVLAVTDGHSFTDAAKLVGRTSGDAVAHLISRFNAQGLSALETRHGAVLLSAIAQSSVSASCGSFDDMLLEAVVLTAADHFAVIGLERNFGQGRDKRP